MAKVIQRNTCYIINGYSMGDSPGLERNFEYWDPVYHKKEIWGMYYDNDEGRLYIPAGFERWKITYNLHIHDSDIYYEPYHPYKSIDNIKMRYTPRDDRQIEALQFMCGVGEYQNTLNQPCLSVNLPTGAGKTFTSIATIQNFRVKSIIITGSTSLLNQWNNVILQYTNLTDTDILNISGSDMINMILSGKSQRANNAKIYLCSHGTLRSFGDKYGWNNVYKLFETLGIGIKIFDEAHQNFQNMLMIDYFTNVWKTFYVTATPGRSSWRENRIFEISIGKVPYIDLWEETDAHTDYLAIKYNSHPSPGVITACKSKYGLDRNKYINWLTQNENFYKMLEVVLDLAYKTTIRTGGRVLMYIGTNDGILRVYKYICDYLPQYIGSVGVFTSLVDKEMKRDERDKSILLSTTKSAGAGEDIPNLKMTVVLAEPFKSEILARQSLGRTRAENTLYVECVDLGFFYTRKFYENKLPVFNKYAKSVDSIVMDSYELNRRSSIIKEKRNTGLYCPIRLRDDRFDFSQVMPKNYVNPQADPVICPITFTDPSKMRPGFWY